VTVVVLNFLSIRWDFRATVLSYTVSEIQRDVGRNRQFEPTPHPTFVWRPVGGDHVGIPPRFWRQ